MESMMTRQRWWVPGLLGILLGLPAAADAFELCQGKRFEDCGDLVLTQTTEQGHECLARQLACGNYEIIVATLHAEQFAPTAVQKYFLGAALYGMHVNTRAKSLQCELVIAGRNTLASLLNDINGDYQETGSFPGINVSYVYHATKMYEDLKGVTGCLESSISEATVRRLAFKYADRRVQDIFLGLDGGDASDENSIAGQMERNNELLQSFVTKASDVEAGVEMRKVELEINEDNMDGIVAAYREAFGGVDPGDEMCIDTTDPAKMRVAKAKARKMLGQSNEALQEFKVAIGTTDPNEYTQIRRTTVGRAAVGRAAAAHEYNLRARYLFPGEGGEHELLGLFDDMDEAHSANQVATTLAVLRRSWNDLGVELWYCPDPAMGEPGPDDPWFCE